MYAVIRTGAKQHRVVKGDRIKVEKLEGDVGAELKLDDVLMIGGDEAPKVGRPRVAGAVVTAKILDHDLNARVFAFKRRKRKGLHNKKGHRQPYTEIEITGIEG